MSSDPALAPAPPPLPARRIPPALRIAAGAVALGLAWALFAFNPTTTHLFPPCPLHALTGLYCPGCGTTRAAHQFLHGHFATAFGLNPLMVVALPFIAYALLRRIVPLGAPARPLPPWSIWALLVVVVAFGVLRNLPWGPVRWMAP